MGSGFHFEHCVAIITGASSGLGAEFARQLVVHAEALVLVARREVELEQRRQELLTIRPTATVLLCTADIATDAGRARVIECVQAHALKPNLLINNAGMGDYGSFADAEEAKIRAQVELNITALLLLTRMVLPLLHASAQAPAAVLNVSSLAGNVPMPDVAVYAATKAFVTSFSEALRVELASRHVVVSALCPGPTPTNFSKTARRPEGQDTDRSGQGLLRVSPSEVVRAGLDALRDNRACVFPGMGVSVAAPLFRVMPRSLLRWILARRHAAAHARQPTQDVKR